MSIFPGIKKNFSPSDRVKWRLSPIRQLVVLAGLIYIAEIVSMVMLYYVEFPNYPTTAFVDGLIMLLLISPGLYWLQLKPTLKYIRDRDRANEAMRESERQVRNLLEVLPVGIWITDAKGEIQHGNQASIELWGGARYVGIDHYGEYKGWWLENGKRIEADEWAAARAINAEETSTNEEIEIECFDGSHKIILNSAVPFYDENQVLAGSVIVNQDISALKHAQRELEEREALFRTAFENLPVGVWLTDETGKIIYGNQAAQTIWGGARYEGMERYGDFKGWWVNTGKRIEPDDWAVARAINKGETSLNEEIEIEGFDGSHKIILNSAIPVRDEKQRIIWTFVVNQDITERKKREQALAQTNVLLERFFTSIGTHIAYMDRDFNFIRVNEAYAKSAGHPLDFFQGKNHFELYPHAENEAIFRRVVETGEPYLVFEKPFDYAEFPELGVTYWDWNLQPVKGGDEQVQGLVLSLLDVTRRKRAEIQLEQQNVELRALSLAEQKQRELAEGLVQSSIAVSSSLNLEKVLATILDQIHRAIPFQMADIALIENGMVRVVGYLSFKDLPEIVEAMKKPYPLDSFPVWLRVYSTQQPHFIADTSEAPDWQVVPGKEWVKSSAVAPLVVGERVIGFINLTSDQPGSFDETMAARLKAFAVPASVAIQNARLYMAESRARQIAEALSTAATSLTKTLDLDQVLHTLMEFIDDIIPSDVSGIGMLTGDGQLAVHVARGYPRWTGPEFIFSVDDDPDSLVNQLITTQKSQLVMDTATHHLVFTEPSVTNIRNWLLVPIIPQDKAIGLVGLGKTEPGYFTQEHIQWVEALATQAAVAIQNAWLFQQVRSSSERLQSLARKLVEVQENERAQIARELHDEAGQSLSVLKISLGRLEQDPECSPQIRHGLEDLKGTADNILEGLHRLAINLRPIALDHLGLVAALEQYAKNLASERLSIKFKALGFERERLPRDVETCLYRIVQEALANVLRHAQASNVGILLERSGDRVKLFVEDDGIGFDPDHSETNHRLGLVGMRERAEMFGGTLTIESYSEKGTSIIVEVPDVNTDTYRG